MKRKEKFMLKEEEQILKDTCNMSGKINKVTLQILQEQKIWYIWTIL